ncbi:Ser/Thr protein phosphatase PP1-1 [Giardia muris]|uniref:Serine/threonine-protein phosphatase n=1 Tax=Giardia muris TaxID=5742 RepID=A0A4Z1T7T4_GIAMU|nr:Ser/Thr protein phosphatase PP1-1 [Giardia muris]|eukprot:TNJ28639.1 Ser/Thr protein phosphatase PP1-1 [Giardia muris]
MPLAQELTVLFLDGPSTALLDAGLRALNTLSPDSPDATILALLIGDIYRCLGKLDSALRFYRRATAHTKGQEIRLEALERYQATMQQLGVTHLAREQQRWPALVAEQDYHMLDMTVLTSMQRFTLIEDAKRILLIEHCHLKSVVVTQICTTLAQKCTDERNVRRYLAEDESVFIIGDIHGSAADLLTLFDLFALRDVYTHCQVSDAHALRPTLDAIYVFLGDYVDRGPYGVQCFVFLSILKLMYPYNFVLLRGNHECRALNSIYGFEREARNVYGRDNPVYEAIQRAFASLPFFCELTFLPSSIYDACLSLVLTQRSGTDAYTPNYGILSRASAMNHFLSHTVDDQDEEGARILAQIDDESIRVFCCHGGAPCIYTCLCTQGSSQIRVEKYENIIQRTMGIIDPIAAELTWNDPLSTEFEPAEGFMPSQRRLGYLYGYSLFHKWCTYNKIHVLFRGHEFAAEGLRHDFSANNKHRAFEYLHTFTASELRQRPEHFTVFSASAYEEADNNGAVAELSYSFSLPTDSTNVDASTRTDMSKGSPRLNVQYHPSS